MNLHVSYKFMYVCLLREIEYVTVHGKKTVVIAINLDRVHRKCALTERSMITI